MACQVLARLGVAASVLFPCGIKVLDVKCPKPPLQDFTQLSDVSLQRDLL